LNTKVQESCRAGEDILIVLENETGVRNLKPDLARLEKMEIRGFIVTGPSTNPDYDFISRFFAPRAGIPEDPVTGSAHCALGPFWGERLNKTVLTGYQASARGRMVIVELCGDRVPLKGRAVTILKGNLKT
jgi:PhzF family phenazine biosynthesis protein